MKTVYRIYGKHQKDKRFKALGSDGFVGNLIYAYFIEVNDEDDLNNLDEDVERLNLDNPEYTFIKRKII